MGQLLWDFVLFIFVCLLVFFLYKLKPQSDFLQKYKYSFKWYTLLVSIFSENLKQFCGIHRMVNAGTYFVFSNNRHSFILKVFAVYVESFESYQYFGILLFVFPRSHTGCWLFCCQLISMTYFILF